MSGGVGNGRDVALTVAVVVAVFEAECAAGHIVIRVREGKGEKKEGQGIEQSGRFKSSMKLRSRT